MTKFEKGDVVKIIANKSRHRFAIGEIVIIYAYACEGYKVVQDGAVNSDGSFDPDEVAKTWCYIDNEDVELV